MALAWVLQDEALRVRQRESLRRAISGAADLLGWSATSAEDRETAKSEVVKLARSGARVMAKELADQLAAKKTEIRELKKSQTALLKIAETGDFSEPIEFTYIHTARKPSRGLVTREVELTLTVADEATDAVAAIEKRLETWGKLREEMLLVLKGKQEEIEEMTRQLPTFVESSMPLVSEVFETLY